MVIPDFEMLTKPILRYASDKQEHYYRNIIEFLANEYNLTEAERKEYLPSGVMRIFDNRVGWTLYYLKRAGLLESTKRGFYRITQEGLEVKAQNPPEIDTKYLKRFSRFQEFIQAKDKEEEEISSASSQSPEESFEYSYRRIRQILIEDLLNRVKSSSSQFFERLVVDLLVRVGYGGSIKEAGKAIGKSGDEGIDGIIKEDVLGLDLIYIQAKRWDGFVGRPEIQKFAGALQGQRAKKGIFITTGSFSKEAQEFISKIDTKIVLIDGKELVELMIDHNVGVSIVRSIEMKKIDSDYFDEPA
jgi:restriction system protein